MKPSLTYKGRAFQIGSSSSLFLVVLQHFSLLLKLFNKQFHFYGLLDFSRFLSIKGLTCYKVDQTYNAILFSLFILSSMSRLSHSTGAIIDHWGKYFDKSENDIDLARPRVDYPMNTFDIRTTVIPFGTFLRAVKESDEVLN